MIMTRTKRLKWLESRGVLIQLVVIFFHTPNKKTYRQGMLQSYDLRAGLPAGLRKG